MNRAIVLRGLLFIIGVIMSTCAVTIILPQVSQRQMIEKANKQAQVEALYGSQNPFAINMSSDFTLCLGNRSRDIVSAKMLENNFDVNNFIYLGGELLPLNIKFVNDSLLISANVTDTEGNIVGFIQDNVWKGGVNQSLFSLYDINLNNFAFEVVDDIDRPLLQIRFTGPNTLDITGYFYTTNILMVATDDKGLSFNPTKPIVLTPIFEYPSESHKGELANPDLFLPDSEKSGIPLSAWMFYGGLISAIGGVVLSGFVVWDTIWDASRKKSKQN